MSKKNSASKAILDEALSRVRLLALKNQMLEPLSDDINDKLDYQLTKMALLLEKNKKYISQ